MEKAAKRGRPRKFEETETLDQIMKVFWVEGYSATSLDQIAAATGLNRPSLYSAFGSKKTMFLKIIDRFADAMHAHLRNAGQTQKGAKNRFKAIMSAAIDLYTGRTELSGAPYGCLAISTLPSEAAIDQDFQSALNAVVSRMDRGFQKLLLADSDPPMSEAEAREIARLLSMLLHGISIRARAGEPSEDLKHLAHSAIDRLLD